MSISGCSRKTIARRHESRGQPPFVQVFDQACRPCRVAAFAQQWRLTGRATACHTPRFDPAAWLLAPADSLRFPPAPRDNSPPSTSDSRPSAAPPAPRAAASPGSGSRSRRRSGRPGRLRQRLADREIVLRLEELHQRPLHLAVVQSPWPRAPAFFVNGSMPV